MTKASVTAYESHVSDASLATRQCCDYYLLREFPDSPTFTIVQLVTKSTCMRLE